MIGSDEKPIREIVVRKAAQRLNVANRDERGRVFIPMWAVRQFRHFYQSTGYLGPRGATSLPRPEDQACPLQMAAEH
jgi:hypothetical protein